MSHTILLSPQNQQHSIHHVQYNSLREPTEDWKPPFSISWPSKRDSSLQPPASSMETWLHTVSLTVRYKIKLYRSWKLQSVRRCAVSSVFERNKQDQMDSLKRLLTEESMKLRVVQVRSGRGRWCWVWHSADTLTVWGAGQEEVWQY